MREICVDVSVLLWLDKFLEAKEVCELWNPQLFLFLYTTFFFGFKPKFRFKPKSFRFKQKSFRFEPKSFRFKQKCCASLACSSLFPLLAAHCFPWLHPTASLSSQKFFRLKTFHAFLLRFQYKNVLLHEKGPADVPRKNVVGPWPIINLTTVIC